MFVTILHLLRIVLETSVDNYSGSNNMAAGKYDSFGGWGISLTRCHSLCWCELWNRVVFESDSAIVQSLSSSSHGDLEFYVIVANIIYLWYLHSNFRVKFIRRQANIVVYTLTRAACSWTSHRIFYSYLFWLNIDWLMIIINFALVKKNINFGQCEWKCRKNT